MTNHNTKILVPGIRAYHEAWPDYSSLALEPSGRDIIRPDEVVPFGFQKFLVYSEPTYGGLFKKDRPLLEARTEAFSEFISGLEEMVSRDGADFVLVDLATNKESRFGWLIQAYAQSLLYK